MPSASPLSAEQVQELLSGEYVSRPKESHSHSIQIGPLTRTSQSSRCAARGCGTPTNGFKVKGISYCSLHAMYALNRMLIPDEYNLDECDCNAGRHSMGLIHTEGCPLFKQHKEK